MGLIRLIVFALLAYFVYGWIKRRLDTRRPPPHPGSTDPQGGKSPLGQCRTCGTWVPKDQLLEQNGAAYCSPRCQAGRHEK